MTRALFLLGLLVSAKAMAGTAVDDGPEAQLTNPRTDVLYLASGFVGATPAIRISAEPTDDRSVAKAFALSAVVPGLGQVYNRSWWKAGIAVAAEAALVTAYVSWRNKGNDGVRGYKAFAHQHWSALKYAEWLNAFSGYSGADIELPSLTAEQFAHPESWTPSQRDDVSAFFDDIRAAERQSSYLTTGAGFSHVLPYFGEQQYYELIGKYFQFAPGWDDYLYAPDADAEAVMPDDALFYYYAGIHADANDFLRRSSWAGAFVIINHFAAAVEAAVSAKLHNMSLRPKAAIEQGPLGEPVAAAGIVVRR